MGMDHQVYKINDSGQNLVKLTNEGDWNRHPIWGHDGNTFSIARQTDSSTKNLQFDKEGMLIDSLSGTQIPISPRSWNDKNKVGFTSIHPNLRDFKIGYFDHNNRESYILYEKTIHPSQSHKYFGYGGTWSDTETTVWMTRHFLGKTNIQTEETEILLETPISHFLSKGLGINPAGTHALVGALDRELIGVCQLDIQYRLYLIDLETGEERRIEIPE